MEQPSGEELARLAEELGDALRHALADSPQVAQVMSRIRAEGYVVSVVLDATIGFSRGERREEALPPALNVRLERAEPLPLRMTPLDRKFLRSLKITADEEE